MNVRRLVALLALLLFTLIPSRARGADDRIQFVRDIVIGEGQTYGDALCFFCSIRVRGTLEGDAVAIGGGIDVDGVVNGDAIASGGAVRLGRSADVEGDVVSVGGPLNRHAGAHVSAGADTVNSAWFYLPGQRQIFWRSLIVFLAINAALGVLAALGARTGRVVRMANTLGRRPILTPLIGVAALVAAMLLYVLANHLGRWQPVLALAVSAGLLITAVAGYTGLNLAIGRQAGKRGSLARVLLATSLIAALQVIPVLGFLTSVIFFLLAIGCAVLSGYGRAAGRTIAVPAGGALAEASLVNPPAEEPLS